MGQRTSDLEEKAGEEPISVEGELSQEGGTISEHVSQEEMHLHDSHDTEHNS